MAIVLMLAAVPLAVINLIGRRQKLHFTRQDSAECLSPWLAAAIVLGVVIALGSELLSLVSALNPLGVAALWLCLDIALLLSLQGDVSKNGINHISDLLRGWRSWPLIDKVLSLALTVESLVLAFIGFVAPPNNVDSLLYHMSRVAHWLQQGSLRHYAASYHHQLWSPPFAEETILHEMALFGTDRLANSVQWLAFIGALAVVGGLAAQLGLKRRGRLLSALVALSTPMAILQASSTQNDLVAAYWAVATLYLLVLLIRSGLTTAGWFALGGAVGLGMLTKVTFYPSLGLVIVAAVALAWRRGQPIKILFAGGALAAILIMLINAGFWLRNWQTYGSPLGSVDYLEGKVETQFSPGAPLADTIQHVALNFATPSEPINRQLEAVVRVVSSALGSPADDFQVLWSWNHEDAAGNPIHMALAWGAVLFGLILPGDRSRLTRWYGLALLLTFVPFAWTVDHGVYRVRYHLTFLLMAAPLVAWAGTRLVSQRVQSLAAFGLLLISLPWLLLNQTRPLIGWQPRTRTKSILSIPRRESLFANVPELREPFTRAANLVSDLECRQVGLSLDSSDPEYALWWLLGAPGSNIRLEAIRPLESLAHYQATDFEPCAAICTNCGGRSYLENLPLVDAFGHVRVFAR